MERKLLNFLDGKESQGMEFVNKNDDALISKVRVYDEALTKHEIKSWTEKQ